MSGQDKKYNNPLNLMSKRLGVFYQQPTGTTIDYTEGIKNERSLMARRMGLLYNGLRSTKRLSMMILLIPIVMLI